MGTNVHEQHEQEEEAEEEEEGSYLEMYAKK